MISGSFDIDGQESIDGDTCPKCGRRTLQSGYGSAGGGMGAYWYCTDDGCDYFDKTQDKEESE